MVERLHAYDLNDDVVANVFVYGAFPEAGFRLWFAVVVMAAVAVGSIAAIAVVAAMAAVAVGPIAALAAVAAVAVRSIATLVVAVAVVVIGRETDGSGAIYGCVTAFCHGFFFYYFLLWYD